MFPEYFSVVWVIHGKKIDDCRLVSLFGCLWCHTGDDPAHHRQSEEARLPGSSPPELRRSEFIPVPFHAPSKTPPTNNQHLHQPTGLPLLWSKPWVQRDYSLTTLPARTWVEALRAFQAALAADTLRYLVSVEWLIALHWGDHVFVRGGCDTGKLKCSLTVSLSALWDHAKSSAEMVANSERGCQWL